MPKSLKKKFSLKFIHLQAVVIFVLYNIISKANFAQALIKNDFLLSFLQVYAFGILSTFAFLYLFSHEDFFQFAKELEKSEKKQEGIYLKKFQHHGKILAAILIGSIGGPIFLALTLRLFFHKHRIQYILVFLIILLSTSVSFGLLRGVFNVL